VGGDDGNGGIASGRAFAFAAPSPPGRHVHPEQPFRRPRSCAARRWP